MPSAITTYGSNYVLNAVFGRRAANVGHFYVALLTQPPGEHADGSTLSEPPSGSGYARQGIVNDTSQWGEAVAGFIATITDVTFPPAITDWPVITHYALCDSVAGGNVYLYGSFSVPRRIKPGDVVSIPPGLLSLTCSSLTTAVVSAF